MSKNCKDNQLMWEALNQVPQYPEFLPPGQQMGLTPKVEDVANRILADGGIAEEDKEMMRLASRTEEDKSFPEEVNTWIHQHRKAFRYWKPRHYGELVDWVERGGPKPRPEPEERDPDPESPYDVPPPGIPNWGPYGKNK